MVIANDGSILRCSSGAIVCSAIMDLVLIAGIHLYLMNKVALLVTTTTTTNHFSPNQVGVG
jgi:hypothetical protein